jgi:formylglycine-generating enzyme required for sulfatase activity
MMRTVIAMAFACALTACLRDGGSAAVPPGMKAIPGGSFLMGREGIAEPVHSVSVSPFFIDSVPVTQGMYRALMHANPSYFRGDGLPVETVTWFDAVLFCNARSKAEGRDTVYSYTSMRGVPGNGCDTLEGLKADFRKRGYRLPTEAEYEFAQRGGSATRYSWGDTVDGAYLWYFANSDHRTQPVARKRPNALGLYDMAGNVLEWCQDRYGPYPAASASTPGDGIGSVADPVGPDSGTYRVLRGSSFYIYYLIIHESAYRFYLDPAPNVKPPLHYYGFRCALSGSRVGR